VRRVDASAFVDPLGRALGAVVESMLPGEVAVAFDYGVCASQFKSFARIQSRVNAAEDDPGSALSEKPPEGIAPERIAGVNADAGDVAGLDAFEIQVL
jgi:hypothetical protein